MCFGASISIIMRGVRGSASSTRSAIIVPAAEEKDSASRFASTTSGWRVGTKTRDLDARSAMRSASRLASERTVRAGYRPRMCRDCKESGASSPGSDLIRWLDARNQDVVHLYKGPEPAGTGDVGRPLPGVFAQPRSARGYPSQMLRHKRPQPRPECSGDRFNLHVNKTRSFEPTSVCLAVVRSPVGTCHRRRPYPHNARSDQRAGVGVTMSAATSRPPGSRD